MKTDYNWISATVVRDGRKVTVRQTYAGREEWVDADNYLYSTNQLDFTQPPDISGVLEQIVEQMEQMTEQRRQMETCLKELMGNKASCELSKAAEEERAYWRKLRGDIALEILHQRCGRDCYSEASQYDFIPTAAKRVIDELAEHDRMFTDRKNAK